MEHSRKCRRVRGAEQHGSVKGLGLSPESRAHTLGAVRVGEVEREVVETENGEKARGRGREGDH